MNNPWLDIPLDDYEGHMQLPTVAQSLFLAKTLDRLVQTHKPRSVAVIGCAGGNGFDQIPPDRVARVVGVDINPVFLAEARRRYSGHFEDLELICQDITSQACRFDPVDLIYAGLIFEYIDVAAGLASLRRLVRLGGVVAVVLQLPHGSIEAITPSPFQSLAKLGSCLRLVPPEQLETAARSSGFGVPSSVRRVLPTGKAFQEIVLSPQ
jgi:hypothetical protein